MRRLLLIALLLVSPLCAKAQISYVGSCSGTTSCTPPTHQVGDLFLIGVGRDGTTTAPTIPAGYTAVTSALTINGTSTADSYFRAYCKVAGSSSETVTGFTSANSLTATVYRATNPPVSSCADVFGTPVTSVTAINTTSTTVTYGSVTNGASTSWDVGLAYAPAATAGLSTAPTGMNQRVTQGTVNTVNSTNAGVSSYSTANITITTASRIMVATMEIKASPPLCGNFTQSATTGIVANNNEATPCTTGSNAGGYTVNSISWWTSNTGPVAYDMGIYSDSSSAPSSLICHVLTGSSATANSAWNTQTITGCGTLSASTKYWIGVVQSGNSSPSYGETVGACANSLFTADGTVQGSTALPNPFGTVAANANCLSMYATLTAAAGGGSKRLRGFVVGQ